ncbi:RAB6-interacting golgin-like [Rhopilema esculentum]|uniref:RAB6-interacting golgin-like n=1 Tax=Rhopilema esculentum TaxID=499914 RepID=UPI0031E158FD
MAGWAGFTDEELKHLKQETNGTNPERQQITLKANLAVKKDQRRKANMKRDKTRSNRIAKELNDKKEHDNDKKENGQALAKEKKFQENNLEKETIKESQQNELDDTKHKDESPESSATNTNNLNSQKEVDIRIISDEDAAEIQMTELEKLQKRQKEMEEENKVKKKIISDTITERFKKAKNEAVNLQTIQKELARLDSLLANDVEILRSKIEEATISYCHAQKRHEKAEKEYVNSKLDLKLKEERKEELTQHLYTIIQENELRKANKLEELMSKLNLPKHIPKEESTKDHEPNQNDTLHEETSST